MLNVLKYCAVALFLFAIVFFATSAGAQQPVPQGPKCAPIDRIVKLLSEQHGEMLIATMNDKRGIPMQLWANLESGSFTWFFLRGDESKTLACFLDEGGNFKIGG